MARGDIDPDFEESLKDWLEIEVDRIVLFDVDVDRAEEATVHEAAALIVSPAIGVIRAIQELHGESRRCFLCG